MDNIEACRVDKDNKNLLSTSILPRNYDYNYFEKRDGLSCDHHLKLSKRHGPEEDEAPAAAGGMAGMAGMEGMGGAAAPTETPKAAGGMEGMEGMSGAAASTGVPAFNVITPNKGKPSYARVSAGTVNEVFFAQADKSGLMTLGAQHGGVSVVGGWMQAGGHNPFVNKLGMQVDNVMEIEVVTADGKFQKVNEASNPELFWALRGGGGGTFGIVTGATIRVFETFPIVVSRFFVNSTEDGIWNAHAHFLQQGARLRDQFGLQGYFYMYEHGFQSVLHMPMEHATLENAKKVTEPLMAEMEKLANAKHIEPKYYEYKTYKNWYEGEMGDEDMEESGAKFLSYYDGSDGSVPAASDAMMNPMIMIPYAMKYPAGPSKRSIDAENMEGMGASVARSQAMARTYLDSRLLSDKHVNSVSLKELAGAINATFPRFPGNHVRGFLYGGGEQAKPDKHAMGLLPAWRDATFHFIINAVPGNIRHDYGIAPIAKLFPDAHAYVNEASPGEPDWKNVFWGEHYAKLETIKKKVDPNNVFWCSPCVGADMLSYDDERICKNPNYPQSGPSPQTYVNKETKVGIASLPGTPGIPNPVLPLIKEYLANHTLPSKMPKSNYFKIAMGEGGSAGGKFADMDPYHPGQKLPVEQADSELAQPSGVGAAPKDPIGAAGLANSGGPLSAVPAPTATEAPVNTPAVAEPSSAPAAEVTTPAAAAPEAAAPTEAAPEPAAAPAPKRKGRKKSSRKNPFKSYKSKSGGMKGFMGFGKAKSTPPTQRWWREEEGMQDMEVEEDEQVVDAQY